MMPLAFELRVLALRKVAPPAHFSQLQWHIQDAIWLVKWSSELWINLRPDERRMFLLLIAEAIEGGDL